MMSLLLSVFVSLLPERYRPSTRAFEVDRAGASLSGILQSAACLFLFMQRYFAFTERGMAAVPTSFFLRAMERGGESAVNGFGFMLLVAFLANPVTLLLLYFLFEGMIRAISVWVTGEVPCTLPLFLLPKLHAKVERWMLERKLGPVIPDEIQIAGQGNSAEYDLLIASCRAKAGWHCSTSVICYRDVLYEIVADRPGDPPRPFQYLLKRRLVPAFGLRQRLEPYTPSEVIIKETECLKRSA